MTSAAEELPRKSAPKRAIDIDGLTIWLKRHLDTKQLFSILSAALFQFARFPLRQLRRFA